MSAMPISRSSLVTICQISWPAGLFASTFTNESVITFPSSRWKMRSNSPTPKMQPPIPPSTLRRLGRASQSASA